MQKQASSGHLTDIYMDLHKFLDKNDDMVQLTVTVGSNFSNLNVSVNQTNI